MPICIKCNKEKDELEFSFRSLKTKKRQSKCKSCTAEYGKNHYHSNKTEYVLRAKRDKAKERKKNDDLINSFKKECVICGEDWAGALDFHHLDPTKKDFSIAEMTSRKKAIEEIKKCIVLCSTCHRKYHSEHPEIKAFVDQLVESGASKTSNVSVRI